MFRKFGACKVMGTGSRGDGQGISVLGKGSVRKVIRNLVTILKTPELYTVKGEVYSLYVMY